MLARSIAALALSFLLSAPAAAQGRVILHAEPGTPVVATEVLVAVGPADEAEGREGITYLTARAVTAPILPVLDSLTAQLTISQHRDGVSFTVIAAPDNWQEATRTLLVALFRDPVDSVATVRQRAATVAELTAREASPADALDRQVDAAVFGDEHPWGRPAVGTARTVGRITVAQVDEYLRGTFTADRALIAIVGPAERRQAQELEQLLNEPGPVLRTEVEAGEPADEPVRQPYQSITAWVAAVYPFGEDADEEALRMLARLALDRVSFGPLRPQVYDSRAEVTRHAGGGQLRLELVVPPREVEEWAERLAGAVAAYADEALPEAQFADRLRRYRGERMLQLESPEARARALARQALLGARAPRLPQVDGLTAARLHAAARALPDPVLVFLGPFEEEDEGDEGGSR